MAAAPHNRWHRLARTLPVHIVYVTAGRAADSELRFRRDVYDRRDTAPRTDLAAAPHPGKTSVATAEIR